MYSVGIHKVVNETISFCYRIGFWHRRREASVGQLLLKWFYCIYYSLFVASLSLGAIANENKDEGIFLAEIAVIVSVLLFKFWVLIWKQKPILELLNGICVFPIKYEADVTFVNDSVESFMKFVKCFLLAFAVALLGEVAVAPFLNSERTLFFKIAFPLDWNKDVISFWIANIFLFTEVSLCVAPLLFAIIVWYLMLTCSLRYTVLRNELANMGRMSEASKPVEHSLKGEWHKRFSEDLKSSIESYLHLRKYIGGVKKLCEAEFIKFFSDRLMNELETFCTDLFLIQFSTSALFICGSVYSLAFNVSDNLVERVIHAYILLYNLCEIFMITYFGNEIMLASDRLTYSFFESNWIEQPYTVRKLIIIFGEYSKQPQTVVTAKLYPLTLQTFTKIVNSAYSMFNLLENMKH